MRSEPATIHFEGIHDALPMRESTDWFSRLTAIVVDRFDSADESAEVFVGEIGTSHEPSPATTITNCCSISKNST